MSISKLDSGSDPVLGSLWVSEDFELDGLTLNNSSISNFQQDGATDLEMAILPSHSLYTCLGWQPDSPVGKDQYQDWGVLDDRIHQDRIQQEAGIMMDDHSLPEELETPYPKIIAAPETIDHLGLFSVASSPCDFLSSSLLSSLLELQSFGNVSIGSSESLQLLPNVILSRSGSTSSLQSERGRTRLKGKPGQKIPKPTDTSVFQEYIFHSNPSRSTSRASAASRRRGPLNIGARATMSAVKEVGACWRCKAMRKSVSPWISLIIYFDHFGSLNTKGETNSAMHIHRATPAPRFQRAPIGELWDASVGRSKMRCRRSFFAPIQIWKLNLEEKIWRKAMRIRAHGPSSIVLLRAASRSATKRSLMLCTWQLPGTIKWKL